MFTPVSRSAAKVGALTKVRFVAHVLGLKHGICCLLSVSDLYIIVNPPLHIRCTQYVPGEK